MQPRTLRIQSGYSRQGVRTLTSQGPASGLLT